MSVIELTTFTVKPDNTAAMLAARPGMVDAFRRDRRGFVTAKLIRVAEDTWLDLVEWTDDTAWDESRAKGGNQPEIAAFFATIDTLVSSNRGVRYDDAEDGRRATRTIAYGPHPSQVGELYLPEGDGPFPVIVLIHGGYWTAMFDRRQVTPLADALVTDGYAVWNVEYRRLGEEGGGWPGTFEDIAAAIDQLDGLDEHLDLTKVLVVGHSAGGQLAAYAAGRTDGKVQLQGAVSIAGVLDLVQADKDRLGSVLSDPNAPEPAGAPPAQAPEFAPVIAANAADGIPRWLLGGHHDEVPDRYAQVTPPAVVPLLTVHGTADDVVAAKYAGDPVEIPDANHFDVINPDHRSWRVVRDWLADRLA
jgi:acetyl esterase/lipase